MAGVEDRSTKVEQKEDLPGGRSLGKCLLGVLRDDHRGYEASDAPSADAVFLAGAP